VACSLPDGRRSALGRVTFVGTPTEAFYNGSGVVSRGYAATMLDSAMGCAINTTAPPGKSLRRSS